jgi:lysozyme family protein
MTEQERFDRCLGAVLRLEGGYVDDDRDPGGPTNLGVTQAVLTQALGRPATAEAVRALTPEAVRPIYRRLYWDRAGCADLGSGVDLMVFDAAVNMGPATAVRMLQAAAKAAPPEALIRTLSQARARRYRSLAAFATFGAGWMRRLETVEALALAWAAGEAV